MIRPRASLLGFGLLLLAIAGCPKRETPADRGGVADSHASTPGSTSAPLEAPAVADGAAEPDERLAERESMVSEQMQSRGITDPRVLTAMRKVPRHRFVPMTTQDEAYADRPLPIGNGQTISQPYIVAFMTRAASIDPKNTCLEIGTGSGYQAAVLAELCAKTYSIEYLPEVARYGAANLQATGYGEPRVMLRVGDGYQGWPEAAPFDAIIVTAAPDHVPRPLLEQLAVGGRMVIPVGGSGDQELERWTRVRAGQDDAAFRRERLLGVRFVPFLGDKAQRKP